MSQLKEKQNELKEQITNELAPKAIKLLDAAMEVASKPADMIKAADAVLAYANLTKNKEEITLQTGAKIATAAITTALKGLTGLVGIDMEIPTMKIAQPEADLIEHEVEEHVHEETINTIHVLEEVEPEEEPENDWSFIDES